MEVVLPAAVGGDVLDREGVAAAHDGLRAVRQLLVGGVPSSELQLARRLLHPVAVAVVPARPERPNLHIQAEARRLVLRTTHNAIPMSLQ